MVTDQIQRAIHIAAPVERVWEVLTRPEHLRAWFAFGGAEADVRPGGAVVFRWEEHGEFHARFETVEPGRRLAYRWSLLPGQPPGPGNSTLVEFTLTPDGEGTRLQVTETGFRALDGTDADRARHVQDNTQGWTGGLDELRDYAARLAA